MSCGEFCARTCRRLIAASIRPDDTAEDVRLKRIFVPVYLIMGLATLVVFAQNAGFHGIHQVGLAFGTGVLFLGGLIPSLLTNVKPLTIAEGVVTPLIVLTIGLDWYAAALLQPRWWAMTVLALDGCMVANTRSWTYGLQIGVTLIWLLFERVSTFVDTGLYEAGVFDASRSSTGGVVNVCACAQPPCLDSYGRALTSFFGFCVIFLTDFYLTNGFAKSMREQLSLVEASVNVSSVISSLLAKYEVVEAQEVVNGPDGQQLPPELRTAFNKLLNNLREFKPYLPHSILSKCTAPDEEELEEVTSVSVPGLVVESHSLTGGLDAAISVDAGPQSPAAADSSGGRSSFSSTSQASSLRSHQSINQPDFYVKRQLSSHSNVLEVRSRGSKAQLTAGRKSMNRRKSFSTVPSAHMGSELVWKNVGLVHFNIVNFLRHVGPANRQVAADILNPRVLLFLQSVVSCKGIVDLINADHLYASFGAGRPCVSFRQAALNATFGYLKLAKDNCEFDLQEKAAVCAGGSLCGDFGGETLKRFCVCGGVASSLLSFERLAAAQKYTDCNVLCDNEVARDAETNWDLRLHGEAICPKRDTRHLRIWFVYGKRERGTENSEWMYEMDQFPNPWDSYNELVGRILRKEPPDEVAKDARAAEAKCSKEEVKEALRSLAMRPRALRYDFGTLPDAIAGSSVFGSQDASPLFDWTGTPMSAVPSQSHPPLD
eukprot:Hpha_TRINITY_DN30895_c0_g1::TRINITY_DN30895_c0_g1_i1::g.155673::m.155673